VSRKRTNAGEGYGYMFHGAFKEKKAAVAKERKTKGAWVKGVNTKHGHRYLVMSPRTNPRKTRPKEPKEPKVTNPTELVVMAANPGDRELTLPAGSTITIRVNPANPDRYTSARARAAGASYQAPGLIQTARQRRVAGMVRHAAGTEGARLMRSYKRHKASGGPTRGAAKVFHELYGRNPSAAALREKFTGAEADTVSVYSEPHMPAGDYAQLGELLALSFKPLAGGQVQQITFPRGSRPIVVADESARQIYFVGGNQELRSLASGTLGPCRRIDYKQRKEHVPDPESDEWRHSFGEESGVLPSLVYDSERKRLLLAGGEYRIEREGIIN
jgi:hypothetical protein